MVQDGFLMHLHCCCMTVNVVIITFAYFIGSFTHFCLGYVHLIIHRGMTSLPQCEGYLNPYQINQRGGSIRGLEWTVIGI